MPDISQEVFNQIERLIDTCYYGPTTEASILAELRTLENLWTRERERKARGAREIAEQAKERGITLGRKVLVLPDGEWMHARLKHMGIGKLARELGCSAPTIRARLKNWQARKDSSKAAK